MNQLVWPIGKFSSGNVQNRISLQDRMEKAYAIQRQNEEATAYLQKAMLPMLELLNFRLAKGIPLVVTRDISYTVSDVEAEEDDGFYLRKADSIGQFKNFRKAIPAGSSLLLKSLDSGLQEFILVDQNQKEHPISFDEKNVLLTNTDIYDDVRNFIESQGA